MYASNLTRFLYESMLQSNVSGLSWPDFEARMDSLRRYGRLPIGRENHATLLTNEHIAHAVLGLASDKPGWAGHASLILSKLQPVGGPDASFRECPTLSAVIQLLLSDEPSRDQLVMVIVTSAEVATNCNCAAKVLWVENGEVCSASFVSEMASSLLQKGAEENFDENYLHAPITKQLVFSKRFFDKLAQETAVCRNLKSGPVGDGHEYDAEEAERQRYEKLGVKPGSRYLRVGVDKYTMVLFPKTKDHVQSISIDLPTNKLSIKDARTIINRFLSLMTWCDDQFAVAQEGSAGNPVPSPVPRRDLAFATTHYWIFDRKIPADSDTCRALALYREARNAEQNFLVSYAVLNYYKIIEIRNKETLKWLAAAFPVVEPRLRDEVLREFHKERGSRSVERHIFVAHRTAVAHANDGKKSDPDSSSEIIRLHIAAEILRELARHFIASELRVSDCIYSGD